jgi:hypothetical protein
MLTQIVEKARTSKNEKKPLYDYINVFQNEISFNTTFLWIFTDVSEVLAASITWAMRVPPALTENKIWFR